MAPLRNRYKYLPFFASPLEEHSEHKNGHASHEPHFPENFESSPEKGQIKHETRPAHARELTFREREEASSIELFYDLFFVANLSSFTGTHDIDSATSTFDTSLILHGTTVLTRYSCQILRRLLCIALVQLAASHSLRRPLRCRLRLRTGVQSPASRGDDRLRCRRHPIRHQRHRQELCQFPAIQLHHAHQQGHSSGPVRLYLILGPRSQQSRRSSTHPYSSVRYGRLHLFGLDFQLQ